MGAGPPNPKSLKLYKTNEVANKNPMEVRYENVRNRCMGSR